MAIQQHPMAALKGTQQGRDLMTQVRSHKTKGGVAVAPTKKPPVKGADVEDAADVASEPGGEPKNEKAAAVNFMNKRRAAAKGA